ncbi:MAG: hypothetical protein E7484_06805 [Ruminococcaceae bacterium]|nr:hypothetical protein [Oscillospiraceae bacterium]
MQTTRKCFYILSAVSIAFNFLFLTIAVRNKSNLIVYPQNEIADSTVVSFSSSLQTSSDIQSSSDNVPPSENIKGYDKNIFMKDLAMYSDVILPYTADKQNNYLSETLFIGDSNTAGLASFGYLPLQNVLGKKSMGIQGVTGKSFVWFKGYSQPVTIVQAVKMLKPRRIIINFGTNNTTGTTAKEFKSMYLKALNSIERAYPYCDIIVAAVLPVGYYRENYSIKQQTIDDFNIVLAEICSEQGYRFLDYTEAFKNKESGYMLSDCVAADGIHLNNKGYHLLLEYINDHQYVTKDRRPDTGNTPIQIKAPANEAAAAGAEAEVIHEKSAAETQDDYNSSQTDLSEHSSSETEQSDTTSDNSSGLSPDLDIINSEKKIYDPFL